MPRNWEKEVMPKEENNKSRLKSKIKKWKKEDK